MTNRENTIYYTITAVVFVGIVVCSFLFHNPGQPINDDSEREHISTRVSVISACITVVATVVLAGITFWYVQLTREILKASDTPEVRIFLAQTYQGYTYQGDYTFTIDLCIENIGTGSARDIIFSGDFMSIRTQHDKALEEYADIKNGRRHLGSGRQIRIPLLFEYNQSDFPARIYKAIVDYKDSTGKEHCRGFDIDFAKIEDYSQFDDPSLHGIDITLQSIDRHLKRNSENR